MDISRQLDIANLPEPQKSTILSALTELVLSRLTEQLYDDLSPEDQAHLDNLDEASLSADDVEKFLRDRFPDFDQRLDQVSHEVRLELGDKTAAMAQVLQQRAADKREHA